MKSSFVCLFIFLGVWLTTTSQEAYLASTSIRDANGVSVQSTDILDSGKVTIIVFWQTCNSRCCDNLDNLHEVWKEILAIQGIQMIGICVDALGSYSHVKPMVDGNSWDFETYIDVNCDLKRAMNINAVPCTILLDQQHQLICRYEGICPGNAELLCEKIKLESLALLEAE